MNIEKKFLYKSLRFFINQDRHGYRYKNYISAYIHYAHTYMQTIYIYIYSQNKICICIKFSSLGAILNIEIKLEF